ncbi:dihydrofolate reductase family protein [Epibacterium sp. Ofav1-8]|uniref:dihydrofolate reductase family protein n=1 Tax=Epibacterium sp. Ofav1-8 TaxID=2917735 RepID=UPI001EF5BAE7|nr:dihydrofolate reductase family protein [Epibacterium sp. Ofav1-8]MCG7625131.1 dihydrofolate reductase family protein [Epibacterium sp. Ofav1-8]
MHPIIYDVSVSVDGFICGLSGDISKFANDGPVVDDYFTRLGTYRMALMGRKTYEFGYEFGLEPGCNPYSHMQSIIFSDSLRMPQGSEVEVRKRPSPEVIRQLTRDATGPVYLCGGGDFAGWMLEHKLIDRLILKRAPCVLGCGVRLFGGTPPASTLTRINTKTYENGYVLEEFLVQ